MVGLGRMGGNMTLRILRAGHDVVVFDPAETARDRVVAEGADAASSLEGLLEKLDPPRVVWLMVPAGAVTAATVTSLAEQMEPGDVVVDGGNSNWKETLVRAQDLEARGVALVDAGTSGGVWGLENGYCLMVGATAEAFALVEPILSALAPPDGYAHVGPPGAGHFVKMVHNGIEYGLLAAYGEGFEILRSGPFDLDLPTIGSIWRNGSVVRSWLLDLLVDALQRDPELADVRGWVDDSGEGRWTVQAAIDQSVPAPITAMSLFLRFASRQEESFAAKVIAALRAEFGGHAVHGHEPEAAPTAVETETSPEAVPGGEL